MNIAKLIDHTLLKADATNADIARLCAEAQQHQFCSVCVNPYNVRQAAELLHGSGVHVCTVTGFPLGASMTEVKVHETLCAIRDGTDEVDMVLNIGALKNSDTDIVLNDVRALADICREKNLILKVILENCLLTDDEKKRASEICVKAGAHFIKTSTGLSTGGATVDDVALMSSIAKPAGVGVKAAGGIRSLADLQKMVAAGATRIGTSGGVKILQELAGQKPAAATDGY
jgi:deoxyribose-phosphate aldolase